MRIADLAGKNICILGYGKEGQATHEAIQKYASGCAVTIADRDEKIKDTRYKEDKRYKIKTGEDYLNDLSQFDVIIKSPGIPLPPELKAQITKLTSATQIFFDSIADSGAMVIGITGSKGKSTTTKLIYEILKAAGKDAHLVGNIGKPAIEQLDKAKKGTIFVFELSSYQLMDLTVSPHIAVVTSFFPEHLDYHGSLEEYLEAKKHITRFQKSEDIVFFQQNFNGTVEIAKEGEGRKVPFSAEDAPLPLTETHLIGDHNLSNIAAAYKVAVELGVPEATILQAIRAFQPLPHRLQSLGMHHGIEWIDDAISTTPESAMAAVNALGDRVKTIIVGGQDRGLDFTEFGEFIAESEIENVILFPGSGPRIKEAIQKAGDKKFFDASSMSEAVAIAKKFTSYQLPVTSTPIVLLSTASPSYGMFKNFEEKGEMFAAAITQ